MIRRLAWASCLVLALWASPGIFAATLTLRPVAVTGTPAPGTVNNFANVNQSFGIVGGHVAFIADTTGPGPENHGVWADDGQGVHLVAADTYTVPGAPGHIFAPSNVTLDGAGHVVFTTMGLQGFSMVRRDGSALSLVMLGSGTAPGTAGTFGIPGRAYMDSNGAAFESGITSGAMGVWTDAFTGSLQKVALAGENAPGGGVYWSIPSELAIGGGRIAHTVSVIDGGVIHSTLISHSASDDTLVARAGDVAPGLGGLTYASFSNPLVNTAGHIAFISHFSSSRDGILADSGGTLAPLVMDQTAAPGIPGGTLNNFTAVAFNGSDRCSFTGSADVPSSGSRNGLWSNGRTGTLEAVALQSAPAPGLAGKFLTDFPTFALSDSGLTAFTADVTPTDRSFQQALYVQDSAGYVTLVACEGLPFEILPVQFATVKDIVFNNGFYDPTTQAFSGNTLAFYLQFDDGRSGLYTATVCIPGDANGDGLVDQTDFTLWYNSYGQTGARLEPDFNCDSCVDQADYTIWYNHYGQSSGTNVPEPMGLTILALGAAAAWRRR